MADAGQANGEPHRVDIAFVDGSWLGLLGRPARYRELPAAMGR